jgi:hypothetical protein
MSSGSLLFNLDQKQIASYTKVSRVHRGDARMASVVPLGNITQSIHLIPLVSSMMPRDWNSATVLERCQSFLVNSFMNTQISHVQPVNQTYIDLNFMKFRLSKHSLDR